MDPPLCPSPVSSPFPETTCNESIAADSWLGRRWIPKRGPVTSPAPLSMRTKLRGSALMFFCRQGQEKMGAVWFRGQSCTTVCRCVLMCSLFLWGMCVQCIHVVYVCCLSVDWYVKTEVSAVSEQRTLGFLCQISE